MTACWATRPSSSGPTTSSTAGARCSPSSTPGRKATPRSRAIERAAPGPGAPTPCWRATAGSGGRWSHDRSLGGAGVMALEIAVGAQKLVINQGVGFLVTEQDGQIGWPTDKGLYNADTRLISSWMIFADGVPWELLNSGNINYYAARIFLTNRALPTS